MRPKRETRPADIERGAEKEGGRWEAPQRRLLSSNHPAPGRAGAGEGEGWKAREGGRAVGGLEPDAAAEPGGLADAPAGVAPERGGALRRGLWGRMRVTRGARGESWPRGGAPLPGAHQARRHGRRGAPRRPARHPLRVPAQRSGARARPPQQSALRGARACACASSKQQRWEARVIEARRPRASGWR